MSGNRKTSSTNLANKKREETLNKTYTVERLLKRRKRKGRTEYLVKWKHYDRSHNSWEPEGNILDRSLIDSYQKQTTTTTPRRSSSPKKSQRLSHDDASPVKKDHEERPITPPLPMTYWYPPICEQKSKFAITDITSDNVTITFRELI